MQLGPVSYKLSRILFRQLHVASGDLGCSWFNNEFLDPFRNEENEHPEQFDSLSNSNNIQQLFVYDSADVEALYRVDGIDEHVSMNVDAVLWRESRVLVLKHNFGSKLFKTLSVW